MFPGYEVEWKREMFDILQLMFIPDTFYIWTSELHKQNYCNH